MKQKHEWILMVKKYTKKKALLFLNPFSFSEVKTVWCESFQIFYYAFKCIILFCVFILNYDILFCYWILKIVYLKHIYAIQNSTLKW